MAPKSLAEQFADLDDPTPKGVYFFYSRAIDVWYLVRLS